MEIGSKPGWPISCGQYNIPHQENEDEPADTHYEVEHHSKEARALSERKSVVVVGLGEVGRPLLELVSEHHNAIGVDITPPTGEIGKVAVVGRTGAAVANSPVRGKHARMLEEMRFYTKFVGAIDPAIGDLAAKHFESLGLKTNILSSPEATELAKLTETTYFGLMIAWAQEVERYCDQSRQQYDEIVSFWEEIKFFPSVKYFPGIIGGHCVMPNIELLNKFNHSVILGAIQDSNGKKIKRDARTRLSDHGITEKQLAVGSRS